MQVTAAGLFVTLEGIDGSGKTTQVERLCRRLTAAGISHMRTREPGGTPIGDAVRALLLSPDSEMTALTEVYLYAAARAEHVQRVILPALQAGQVVICDRFIEASIAYQGYGLADAGISPQIVKAINEFAVQEARPLRTLIIDVPVAVSRARLEVSGRLQYAGQDRIERRGEAFFERVRAGLRAQWEAEPERIVWLDGCVAAEELEERIWSIMTPLLATQGHIK